MKLLIITQKVDRNDPILGFFHTWISSIAKHFDKVIVVSLSKGIYNLPENVKVLSLGKEKGLSKSKQLRNFYKYIVGERKNYDAVFVHMNQIYVVLGGLLWRLWGKKISLWYTHRSVTLQLRIATMLSNHIFTASKESFNIKTKKVNIVGHGIDTVMFRNIKNRSTDNKVNMISVGRITRIKNLSTLIDALYILKKNNINVSCDFVGPVVTFDDGVYLEELKKQIKDKKLEDNIYFRGSVSNENIREYYWKSDFAINLTPTGGLDKSVLEAMASGSIPLASNKTFENVFENYKDRLIFKFRDGNDLALKITKLINSSDRNLIADFMVKKVRNSFDTENVVSKITSIIKND